MTDRDRLAADLHNDPEVGHGSSMETFVSYNALADRLIALGWTRLDESDRDWALALETRIETLKAMLAEARAADGGWDNGYRTGRDDALGSLDEERLARALRKWGGSGRSYWRVRAYPFEATEADAAAIAKAYREDEG